LNNRHVIVFLLVSSDAILTASAADFILISQGIRIDLRAIHIYKHMTQPGEGAATALGFLSINRVGIGLFSFNPMY